MKIDVVTSVGLRIRLTPHSTSLNVKLVAGDERGVFCLGKAWVWTVFDLVRHKWAYRMVIKHGLLKNPSFMSFSH